MLTNASPHTCLVNPRCHPPGGSTKLLRPYPHSRFAPRPLRLRMGVRGAANGWFADCPSYPAGKGALSGAQMRLNTSVPLVPPNPKPLDITTSTCALRATFGT